MHTSRARGRLLWGIAAATGVALGGVSLIPYFGTGNTAHYLGNSAAIWLASAFAVGTVASSRRQAAAAGVLTLLVTVEAFAAGVQILYGTTQSGWVPLFGILLLWAVPAIAGGSIFGAVGWFWRTGTPARRGLAAGAMGAAFFAEAAYMLLNSADESGAIATAMLAAVLGTAAILVLARERRARMAALAWLPAFLVAGVGALFVSFHIVTAIARG